MKSRFVIIDGNAILHRAWHAFPPLTTKDGRVVSAAYGFTVMLLKVMKDLAPTHLAVTFDLPGETFRHEAFAAYKAHRVEQPDELYAQIPMVKEVLKGFRIPVFEMPGYEADDVIGTLTMRAPKGAETYVVTGDLDTLQLVDERTKVYTSRKGMSDVVVYDEAAVKERYGLKPGQLIDYKAMRGDPSDNLPGLKGIGEKGASELLKRYGTLEKIFAAVKKSPNDFKPGILKSLQDGEKDAPLSKMMVTIVRDLPLEFDFQATKLGTPDFDKLRETFVDLEFKTLLPKVEKEFGGKNPKSETRDPKSESGDPRRILATARKRRGRDTRAPAVFSGEGAAEKFTDAFKDSGTLAVRFSYLTDDRIAPRYAAIAICDGVSCAAFLCDGTLPKAVAGLLAGAATKVGHDLKNDLIALARAGHSAVGPFEDVMLMSYLLNPGSRAHALSDLLFAATGQAGGQETLFAEDRARTLAEEAAQLLKLADELRAKLEAESLAKVYEDIELPLMPVLSAMEMHGIEVDAAFLAKMETRMEKRLAEVSAAIVSAAGGEFNINSPAQIGKVLFETLGLPTKGIKRTATGQWSTGADELEKLRGAHPIIEQIFEHREYAKLLSTYVKAIPQLIHPATGRLHTRYNQAVAATGRLSSSDPNLQNIPIRTELGREIRKAFVAPKGRLLLAADYSQFELRIAASIAEDAKMMEAFRSGADIHTATAAEVWDVPADQVTFEQRRAAKAINFGILYGMGAGSLAASAGLTREEASGFIKKYLSVYSGLRDYMEAAKAQARSLGHVETLFGRRRYLPDINSGVPYLKAEAERMAINMPIQGSQADIIKLAMLKIHERIASEYGFAPDARLKMLLQVHDELVFEVEEGLVKDVAPWIVEAMESAVKLKVPVDVEAEIGKSWGNLESFEM